VWATVLLGAAFSFLNAAAGDRTGSSALWFLDPWLYAVLLLGLLLRARGRLPVWRPASVATGAAAYVALCWLVAMIYELSLRMGDGGFGGLHPTTATSFILAQGYYLPLAAGGWWLLRRFHYDFNWVFWTGALASLYETITVGGAAVASGTVPLPLVPLLLAYYMTTYGLYLAMPLLLIDERALWRASGGSVRPSLRIAIGVGFGSLLWVVYLIWAGVVGQFVTV
jgi:hypothetical protein